MPETINNRDRAGLGIRPLFGQIRCWPVTSFVAPLIDIRVGEAQASALVRTSAADRAKEDARENNAKPREK